MNESEQKAKSIADQKKRIRERYKGIDIDALDVIPAIPQEDFYRAESDKRVAVYARVSQAPEGGECGNKEDAAV